MLLAASEQTLLLIPPALLTKHKQSITISHTKVVDHLQLNFLALAIENRLISLQNIEININWRSINIVSMGSSVWGLVKVWQDFLIFTRYREVWFKTMHCKFINSYSIQTLTVIVCYVKWHLCIHQLQTNWPDMKINPFSAGIDSICQNLTSVDIRLWRLKSIPSLKE